ncbi:MAG: hypothetical protein IPM17_12190 [Verrucomicrobia bacterium]|nr:hypothetical protein [Verrucomicrobiota bacterium]
MTRLHLVLTFAAFLAGGSAAPAWTSAAPVAGRYQIVAGTYEIHGGIFGVLKLTLPAPTQAFIELNLTPDGHHADLLILGADRKSEALALTGGTVSPEAIRFHRVSPHPTFPGVMEETDYVAKVEETAIVINGATRLLPPPCCDVPGYFGHTEVAAVREPALTIRVSEVELCWPAAAGFAYQLQSCSDLASGLWTDVGPPVAGQNGVLCVTQSVPAGATPQFYRIVPALGR